MRTFACAKISLVCSCRSGPELALSACFRWHFSDYVAVLRIPPAYYSRIPNSAVLTIAGAHPLSDLILKQQMLYMGKLARRHGADPVRQTVFGQGYIELKPALGAWARGRPRQQWGPCVLARCLSLAGSEAKLTEYFSDLPGAAAGWQRLVAATRK